MSWHGQPRGLFKEAYSKTSKKNQNTGGKKTVTCPPTHTYAGDGGSIPGPRKSPGEGNGNPLQYSCLKNPMDRGAWQSIVHGVAKNWK